MQSHVAKLIRPNITILSAEQMIQENPRYSSGIYEGSQHSNTGVVNPIPLSFQDEEMTGESKLDASVFACRHSQLDHGSSADHYNVTNWEMLRIEEHQSEPQQVSGQVQSSEIHAERFLDEISNPVELSLFPALVFYGKFSQVSIFI